MKKIITLVLSMFITCFAVKYEDEKFIKKEPRMIHIKKEVKLDPKKRKIVVLANPEEYDSKVFDGDLYAKRLKNKRRDIMKQYDILGDSVGHRSFRTFLDDKKVNRLRNNPLISEIYDEVDGKWGVKSDVIDLAPNFSELATYPASVNAAYFTNLGYMGQGINVGVNEVQPLDTYYINGFLNFPGFSVRPYNTSNPIDDHGVDVVSIIKNANQHNSFFQGGGSPSINSLSVSYIVNGETNSLGSFEWTANNNPHIVNNSLGFTDMATGNDLHSRVIDIQSASWPYILHVFSSGNDNDVVSKKCHNCVVVGSVDANAAKSSFSSWANPTNDEVPHVMAKGEQVLLHSTSTRKNGTSFAAPNITALAADAYSIFSHYISYPEAFKTVLMNSCDRSGDFDKDLNDEKMGMGVPNGEILYKISENRFRNAHTSYDTQFGVADFNFSPGQSTNTVLERTLTVPNVSGQKDIQFTMTFLSNPEGTCVPGNPCGWDDVDLWVYDLGGTSSAGQSTSSYNTTEVTRFQHTDSSGGTKTYLIRIYLYNRYTNKTIFGALSWKLI